MDKAGPEWLDAGEGRLAWRAGHGGERFVAATSSIFNRNGPMR